MTKNDLTTIYIDTPDISLCTLWTKASKTKIAHCSSVMESIFIAWHQSILWELPLSE